MNKAFISAWRLGLVVMVVMAAFGGIFGRLYYLHVWESKELQKIAENNRRKLEIKHSRRGNIVDIRGNLLASTRTVVEVGLDPQAVELEDEPKLPLLAFYTGMPLEQLRERFNKKTVSSDNEYGRQVRLIRWSKIADAVSEDTYKKILALQMAGVYGNRKYERVYPGRELAAHLMGFLNKEGQSVGGVEAYLDFYLRGQDGWWETEMDGHRQEMARFRAREVEAVDGLNVEMTIDIVVQNIIEMEIANLVREFNPQSATILVSEPATGFILGLANYPSFDPNAFWLYPVDSHRNRAATDILEPGSTFKIVASSAALNENLVTPESLFDCGRSKADYRGRLISLPEDSIPHGVMTVHDIVSKSSNRGAAQLGMLLGAEKLYNYARAFGFGEKSGFNLSPETNGMLHEVSLWDRLTISRLPMGHAVGATPLQIHFAMSVMANGGVLMTPRVARRVLDQEGRTVVSFPPRAKRRVVRASTARTMAGFLTDAVGIGGTAPRAAIAGYEVAGKTGTTQKVIDGEYSHSHHVATFSGFFPASRPQLVITVIVDDPELPGTAYGGRVAAPVFKNVAKQLIPYLAIQPPSPIGETLAFKEKTHARSF